MGKAKGKRKGSSTTSRRSTPFDPDWTGGSHYIEAAIAYAEDAVADRYRKRYNRWIRLAAKRFLKDLKRAHGARPPFNWSPRHAIHACMFLERLPHVEGVWDSATFVLTPSQCFFVVQIFGFRRHDGTRRFTTALYLVARKNAKSTLAAGLLLYVHCCENEPGAQVVSAATTGDQARIVFNIAKRMVEAQPAMQDAFDVEAFARTIVRYDNGGVFKAINAKASTQDGLNPSAIGFDELHAHKTRDLYDVLRSASGARRDPLFLYTTTEGYINAGPWNEVRTFVQQVLQGVVKAEHFLAVMYGLDDEDDEFDESKWCKANPLLDVSISLDKLREHAIEAKNDPGSLAEFQIKRLNRPSATSTGFINIPKWRRCSGAVDLDAMEGHACYAGLDLASTTDLTAWRLLWFVDGHWFTWGRFWVPEEQVRERSERGVAPYEGWVNAGWITQTEGDVVDYAVVRRQVLSDFERFAPRGVGYDQWNATQLALELADKGVPMEKFIQGTKSYHPAMQALDRAYRPGNLSHGNDPVLTWNAANLVPRYDANKSMAPDRKRSADKIDGMVALLMAFGLAERDRTELEAAAIQDPIKLKRG